MRVGGGTHYIVSLYAGIFLYSGLFLFEYLNQFFKTILIIKNKFSTKLYNIHIISV